MLQVKVFNYIHEDDLTKEVNKWLEENPDYKVKDIKFSTDCYAIKYAADYVESVYSFSAMIIYEI